MLHYILHISLFHLFYCFFPLFQHFFNLLFCFYSRFDHFLACYNCGWVLNHFQGFFLIRSLSLLWFFRWQVLISYLFLFFFIFLFHLFSLCCFIEFDLIQFFKEVVGFIASIRFLFILVDYILLLEVVLLLADDRDEVIEVLVEVDALGVVEPELVARVGLGLFRVSPRSQVGAGVLDGLFEALALDGCQQFEKLLPLVGSALRRRENGFELVDDEAGGTTLRGAVEGKEINWIVKAGEFVDEADTGAGILLAVLLAQHQHSQDEFFVELFLGGLEVEVVGAEVDLLGDDGAFWGEIGGDVDAALVLLDAVDGDLGVEDVGGAVDGGDAAEGLRNVADAVVHVEVGDFAVDAAGLDELAELLDEAAEGVEGADEGGDGSVVVVLVVADDVGEIVHDLSVLLDQPFEEGSERLLQLLFKLHIEFLLDIAEALVELLRRVLVLGQLHETVVDLDEFVQAHQEGLLLEEGELLGLEDLALRQRDWSELAVVEVEDIVDQVEVHVFVHICVLEALAGEAGREEEVRLDVDVKPAVFVSPHAPVVVLLVPSRLPCLRQETVHALASGLCGQKVELLQGDGLQRGAVGFLGIDDEAGLGLGLRFVGGDEAFLQACAEDDVFGSGLVLSEREWQLVVEVVLVHQDNSDLLI